MEQCAKNGRPFTYVLCQFANLALSAQLLVPHERLLSLMILPLDQLTAVLLASLSLEDSALFLGHFFLYLNGFFVH